MKNILLINDIAGVGKVASSVMIPVLSHLGIETSVLPTALVSNTLDYGKFDILDTTAYMENTIKIWNELNFDFDAVSTGFIVSEKQAEIIYNYCKALKGKGAVIFTDPIMGDEGSLYPGISPDAVEGMKKLCSAASVIMPNITEACFLTDTVQKKVYSEEDIKGIINKLRTLGAENIIITSCNIDCNMYTVINENGITEKLPYSEIPVRFPGTGDIFSSVAAGRYLCGADLKESAAAAMRAVEKLIEKNIDKADKYRGIAVEHFFGGDIF